MQLLVMGIGFLKSLLVVVHTPAALGLHKTSGWVGGGPPQPTLGPHRGWPGPNPRRTGVGWVCMAARGGLGAGQLKPPRPELAEPARSTGQAWRYRGWAEYAPSLGVYRGRATSAHPHLYARAL